jgi:hypothetical protein
MSPDTHRALIEHYFAALRKDKNSTMDTFVNPTIKRVLLQQLSWWEIALRLLVHQDNRGIYTIIMVVFTI